MSREIGFLLLAVALAMGAVALLLLQRSQRRAEEERIASRVAELSRLGETPAVRSRRLAGILDRSGVEWDAGLVAVAVAGVAVAGLLGALYLGAFGFLLGAGVAVGVLAGVLHLRYRRRVDRIVAQLPGFLEHMIRSLRIGRSVDGAFRAAVGSTQEPLGGLMRRVLRTTELGGNTTEALLGIAQAHRVRDLQLIALGMRVNHRFGGNASDLFENIVAVLRQQDRSRRQLKAMTGETRISAMVLAVIPVAIAGYMTVMNPDYYAWMLEDTTGRVILIGALAWQALGIFVLWRMLKSI